MDLQVSPSRVGNRDPHHHVLQVDDLMVLVVSTGIGDRGRAQRLVSGNEPGRVETTETVKSLRKEVGVSQAAKQGGPDPCAEEAAAFPQKTIKATEEEG